MPGPMAALTVSPDAPAPVWGGAAHAVTGKDSWLGEKVSGSTVTAPGASEAHRAGFSNFLLLRRGSC